MTSRFAAVAEALGTRAPEELRYLRAPGRVNLIGDHTDYSDGFVLPLAIDRDCLIAFAPREDTRVQVRSLDVADSDWERFVDGSVAALADRGRAPTGIDAALSSTVPVGSGLSSSSALSVAPTPSSSAPGRWLTPRSTPRYAPPACPAVSWTSSRRCSAGAATHC